MNQKARNQFGEIMTRGLEENRVARAALNAYRDAVPDANPHMVACIAALGAQLATFGEAITLIWEQLDPEFAAAMSELETAEMERLIAERNAKCTCKPRSVNVDCPNHGVTQN